MVGEDVSCLVHCTNTSQAQARTTNLLGPPNVPVHNSQLLDLVNPMRKPAGAACNYNSSELGVCNAAGKCILSVYKPPDSNNNPFSSDDPVTLWLNEKTWGLWRWAWVAIALVVVFIIINVLCCVCRRRKEHRAAGRQPSRGSRGPQTRAPQPRMSRSQPSPAAGSIATNPLVEMEMAGEPPSLTKEDHFIAAWGNSAASNDFPPTPRRAVWIDELPPDSGTSV